MIVNCLVNSKIAQHANQFGHNMDFDHATIVDKAVDHHKETFPGGLAFKERPECRGMNI